MATFTTTDQAQMRRHGRTVREAFEADSERVPTIGYVHAIRPDFMATPLRWTIVIEAEKTARRQKVETVRAIAIALQ